MSYRCYCNRRKHTPAACPCYCADCGRQATQIDMFMLKDELWQEICGDELHTRQILCADCAQDRLGRSFRPDDLTGAPVNNKRRQQMAQPEDEDTIQITGLQDMVLDTSKRVIRIGDAINLIGEDVVVSMVGLLNYTIKQTGEQHEPDEELRADILEFHSTLHNEILELAKRAAQWKRTAQEKHGER